MALAAASLEWQVASCLVVIVHENSPDAETASLRSVNKNMETLRTWFATDSNIAGALKVWADKWLDDAKRAIDTRNRIVHSVMVIDGADDGGPTRGRRLSICRLRPTSTRSPRSYCAAQVSASTTAFGSRRPAFARSTSPSAQHSAPGGERA
jgi:hypothetical protein